MSIRPSTRFALAVILAFGTQVSWANPRVVSAELRAMSHCAQHSDRPMSLPETRACCGVTAIASGPAEGPVAGPPVMAAAALVTLVAPPAPVRSAAVVREPSLAGTGPPRFLEHRHLLI